MLSAGKIFVSSLILCAYGIALFNPFYAFFEYALNKQYISQILCENKDQPKLNCEGKCYLAKRIIAIEETPAKERKPVTPKNFLEKELLSLCQRCEATLHIQDSGKLLPMTGRTVFSSKFYTDIFHPPRLHPTQHSTPSQNTAC